MMDLTSEQTSHAMGIAEYHGPRSQMMRCIDHPTMLKDGSGWGAMCGVAAARMAKAGFTGAPAITLGTEHWSDLGQNWLVTQQYFKPYPVCRWAQAPIAAVLDLKSRHSFASEDIANIHITSFHEAVRLGQKTVTNTEEAQYSTSFPCAVALVHNNVLPEHVAEKALKNPEVQRLSSILTMGEDEKANSAFPEKRFAKADITLIDGQILSSTWFEPRWDFEDPPTESELVKKFYDYAKPVLGQSRTKGICDAIFELDKTDTQHLFALISSPTQKSF
jgi:2-methylcitrate dehydratase PrpD